MPTYAVKLLAAGLIAWVGWAALTVTQGDSAQALWFYALTEILFWTGVLLLGSTLLSYVMARHAGWLGEQTMPPEPEDVRDDSWAPHGGDADPR